MKQRVIAFTVCFFCFSFVHATVKLPRLISDSMVLQRDMKIPVWGWASPGEEVTITFNDETYTTHAGDDKKWSVSLPAMKEGGPYDMIIKGKNKIVIKDILVGDVWLCSGQSNMEYKMDGSKQIYTDVIANSTNKNIRVLTVNKKFSFIPIDDIQSDGWKTTNPQSILKFTAVGYFFAKELYEKYKVPIGLIHSSWGGTPAQAWVSEESLKEFPDYLKTANSFKDTTKVNEMTLNEKATVAGWYAQAKEGDKGQDEIGRSWSSVNYDASAWKKTKLPVLWDALDMKGTTGVVWLRKEIELSDEEADGTDTLMLGMIRDQDTTYFNGVKIGFTTNVANIRKYVVPSKLLRTGKNIIAVRVLNTNLQGGFINKYPYRLITSGKTIDISDGWQYQLGVSPGPFPKTTNWAIQPTSMYNGMLNPLIPYGIKGVIWYQGESNASKPSEYYKLFTTLINEWRSNWQEGDFPFLYVQLANYLGTNNNPSESPWAEVREAQFKTLSLPNTGMAVIHDLGDSDNIHPLNKQDVGKRLALAAEKVAYKEKNIVYSGPTYESIKVKDNKIIVKFNTYGSELEIKGGGELKYFAIAGADKKFVWASAKIEGNKIIVWNDQVTDPVAVRYAWANNPMGANLYNKDGLPATSFRTDDWVVSGK